jgi:hypothetical protein
MLLIEPINGGGYVRKPPCATQSQLEDSAFPSKFCKFNDVSAFVPELDQNPDEALSHFSVPGYIDKTVHSVFAVRGDSDVLITDASSRQSAEDLIHQFSFQSGHYNRCWEINARHVPYWARSWIKHYVEVMNQPSEVFFQAFVIPNARGGSSFGFRFFNTPWTHEHLASLGIDSRRLLEAQQIIDIPQPLIELLHLAAEANTHVLIFNPEAPLLAGLPIVD